MNIIIITTLLAFINFNVNAHTINCQTNSSSPGYNLITLSETISPNRRIVVFRNCESRYMCTQCSDCGVCDVIEDSQDFHKIYYPQSTTNWFVVVLTTSTNSEVYCYLTQNLTTGQNYELDIASCPLSSCPSNIGCSSCQNAGCSYCSSYGCVSGNPTSCSNSNCCSLHTDCGSCTSDSSCTWCNSNRCVSNNTKMLCDRSESLTCNVASNYNLQPGGNSKILGRKFAFWNGSTFVSNFLSGIDVGVTLPGMSPGELQYISYDDWFKLIELAAGLKVDVIRTYTLLPPQFYQAFYNYNMYLNSSDSMLFLIQGVWSPLDGASQTSNAWDPLFTNEFRQSISEVVHAVHGNISINSRYGQAYGTYTYDVTRWLGGFILGTEWDPVIVNNTNYFNSNPNVTYTHFMPIPNANLFEQWLAYMMDLTALENNKYNLNTPIAFTNWVTTDLIFHPLEPYVDEDSVSLDANHIIDLHSIGMFSSFHAYPYYPDSLRFEYNSCVNCQGSIDSYAGYIRELRRLHSTMPLVISEIGLSTSRVSAHDGPQRRNQGGLTESEQAQKIIDLMWVLFDEDVDGGFIFSLVDEWFKKCWTTMYLEIPETRQLWSNKLAAEEFFGLISADSNLQINVDGLYDDWSQRTHTIYNFSSFNVHMTNDESSMYFMLERNNNLTWNLVSDEILIGFDVFPGGYNNSLTFYQKNLNNRVLRFDGSPNSNFGVEFVLQLGNGDFRLYVNNMYDPFIYKFGYDGVWSLPVGTARNFEDFRLPLSYTLDSKNFSTCPESFSYLNAGYYNTTMSDYNVNGKYLEFRVLWNFLGFMDPANHQVWMYPTNAERSQNIKIADRNFNPNTTTTINLEIQTRINNQRFVTPMLTYNWNNWNEFDIKWSTRLKPSYMAFKNTTMAIHNSPIRQCTKRLFNCKNYQKLQCVTTNSYFNTNFPTNIKTVFYPYYIPNYFNQSTTQSVLKNYGLTNKTCITTKMTNNMFLTNANNAKFRVNIYQDPGNSRFNETIVVVGGATTLSVNQNFSDKLLHYVDREMVIPTKTAYQYLNTTNTTLSYIAAQLNWNVQFLNNVSNLYTLFIPSMNNLANVMNLCNSTVYCLRLLNCHLASDIYYKVGLFNGVNLINNNGNTFSTSSLNFASTDNTMINAVSHVIDNVIDCF